MYSAADALLLGLGVGPSPGVDLEWQAAAFRDTWLKGGWGGVGWGGGGVGASGSKNRLHCHLWWPLPFQPFQRGVPCHPTCAPSCCRPERRELQSAWPGHRAAGWLGQQPLRVSAGLLTI